MRSRSLTQPRPLAAAGATNTQLSLVDRLRLHQGVFLLVILTAQLMVVLDSTVVNVALPHMQAALGFSGSALSWVLNAYILTFGGLLLLGARAGDLFGRRRVFLAGIAIFTLSSLAGGFAETSWMLLASRGIQGIGAALAAPSALSLLTTVFPEGQQRMKAIGLYTTVSAAGGAIGLVAGGLLTELVSWRWVMFVNVPIGLAVFLLGRIVLAETQRRQGHFDLPGALSSTAGMTFVVLGLVEAGASGWTSPLVVASLAMGLLLLAVFVRTERRAEEPVLPLRLLAHPERTAANVARGLLYAGMFAVFFFTVQFLQDLQHYSPLRTGLAFLPMPTAVFLSSQLTSRVLVRRFPEKLVMMAGISSASLGLLWASRLSAVSPYSHLVVTFLLLGYGLGSSFVSLTSAGLRDVDPADAGAASGLINVSQQLGAALGLAVLVTAFGSFTHHAQLGARLSAADMARAQGVLVHGLDDVFRLAVVFTLSALVLVGVVVRRPRPVVAEVPDRAGEDLDVHEWAIEMAEAG